MIKYNTERPIKLRPWRRWWLRNRLMRRQLDDVHRILDLIGVPDVPYSPKSGEFMGNSAGARLSWYLEVTQDAGNDQAQ